MKLRPCQSEARAAVLKGLAAGTNGLVRMPTGAGKSGVVAAVLYSLHRAAQLPLSVGVVTSRTMLVDDLFGLLSRGLPSVGRLDGHRKIPGQVIVTTYASLDRAPHFDLLICDEAHRTKGKRIRRLLKRHGQRVGFTATPHGRNNSDRLPFDELWYNLTYHQAVDQQVIVPFRPVYWTGEERPVGDEGPADPRRAVPMALDMIAATGGPSAIGPILFTADDLTTAGWIADQIRERGWTSTAAIPRRKRGDGGMGRKQIRKMLADFGAGKVQTLTTVDLLSEGIDVPAIRAVALCAKPRGRNHLCQIVGRAMRVCAADRWGEKSEAIVFDPAGILLAHGLEHSAAMGEVAPERPKGKRRQVEDRIQEVALSPWGVRVSALSVWSMAILRAAEALSQVEQVAPPRRMGPAERALPATAAARQDLLRLLPVVRYISGPAQRSESLAAKRGGRGRVESKEEEKARLAVGAQHQQAIRKLAESEGELPQGVVVDLVQALTLVARCRSGKERALRAAGVAPSKRYAELAARAVVRLPEGLGLPGVEK